jgi:hypothetical protein
MGIRVFDYVLNGLLGGNLLCVHMLVHFSKLNHFRIILYSNLITCSGLELVFIVYTHSIDFVAFHSCNRESLLRTIDKEINTQNH